MDNVTCSGADFISGDGRQTLVKSKANARLGKLTSWAKRAARLRAGMGEKAKLTSALGASAGYTAEISGVPPASLAQVLRAELMVAGPSEVGT